MRSLQRDIKRGNRLPSAACQNHGSGFRHIARPARAVNGERNIAAFLQPARHDRKAFDRATRRASLRRAEPEPLDHAPRPLPVEIHGVEHHDSAVAPDPDRGKNAAVPERPDGWFAAVPNLYRVVYPHHFCA